MKILICTGASEPLRSPAKCFIRAFKEQGHEVITAGAVYGAEAGLPNVPADIPLPDKPHPEFYTYREVLDQCPWTPDFILQIESHFYFNGDDKPDDIISFALINDSHRWGVEPRNAILQGKFNAIFLTQPFFSETFSIHGLETYFVPQAVDIERIKHYPNITPECEICFTGETGIHRDLLQFEKYDNDGHYYLDKLPDDFILDNEHGEYAERAQLLGYLIDDFDLRIYAPSNDFYSKIIQKGEVGFHRSLFKDLTLKLLEIPACKRLLVADRIDNIDMILENNKHYVGYKQFGFNPFFPSFKLDYEQLKVTMKKALENPDRVDIMEEGYRYIIENHTFKNRVEQIIEIYETQFKR